jgi:hypothetical protein
MVITDLLYVLGSRSLDDSDLLAVDRDEHWTSTRLFKMVGKQGLSSISLLLFPVAVGIAPALSDRSLRAAAPL